MKIFLTGGTGFIGSYFIENFIDRGDELICLRRLGSKNKRKLNNEPVWIEGTYEDNLVEAFKGCDVFVHLAAHSTNFPYDRLENCLHENVVSPLKMLQNAKKNGIQKFIIIGTGFEYGLSGEKYDFIPVEAPLIPKMNYPVSKAVGSLVFSQWALENNLKLKYLRIFQVYGEGEDKNRLKINKNLLSSFLISSGLLIGTMSSSPSSFSLWGVAGCSIISGGLTPGSSTTTTDKS